jgi:CubicO group peptidase (beta-lactamase class C family)
MRCILLVTSIFLLSIGAMLAMAPDTLAQSPQPLPLARSVNLEPLFSAYADPTGPAIVVIVVRNGAVIYQYVSGFADLERHVRATMDSMFEVGSTAKMFTAFLVEKLIQSGRLSEADNVRQYLPDLPDYGRPILIDDLLHHTSGLRDYFELMAMRGVRLDDSMSQEDALRLIYRQRKLNFEPGTAAAYSNSDFVLLGQIVQKVTGKSLADYASETLFRPARMQTAVFATNRNVIMANRALSYVRLGPGKEIALPMDYEVTGPSGLWLSGNDLVAWLQFLGEPEDATKRVLARMEAPGKLCDGEEVKWGAGLQHALRAGVREFYHAGGNQGYRSVVAYFPERALQIGIMTNAPSADPEDLAGEIADRILDLKAAQENEPVRPMSSSTAEPGTSTTDLVGTYYSDELDTSYRLSVRGSTLIAEHIRNPAVELKPAGPDTWIGEMWWFKTLKVVRDSQDKIIAFRLSGFRGARDVQFCRVAR